MAIRLASRTKFPPGQFQVLHPEAGMKQAFEGGFQACVEFEYNFRKSNPSLAQINKWSLDFKEIEQWVDLTNAQRLIAHGWVDFVIIDEQPVSEAQKKTRSHPGLWRRSVAAGLNSGKSALAAYTEMFGARGPVDHGLAVRRAEVCVTCPENDTKLGLFKRFVKAVADEIMSLLSVLKDMGVETVHDEKLGVCNVCDCPMRAKVHVSIENIREHMPKSQLEKLPSHCWILKEQ